MESKNGGPLLIVEDGDEDYEVLALTLRSVGVANALVRCSDGDAALQYLRQGARPLMILLDLNLGATDGREVLRELRREPRLRGVPVMVLSTSNNPRDVALCYREGANCYAVKPIGLEKLERLIASFKEFWLDNMELPDPHVGVEP